MAPVTAYTAICEREDDWWVVTVPELESGRVTQARTLDEVPATVADLVATMTGADPKTIEVNVQAHSRPGSRILWPALLAAGLIGAGAVAIRLVRAILRVPIG
jgi:predicted RNase H-like HicB family nuclease